VPNSDIFMALPTRVLAVLLVSSLGCSSSGPAGATPDASATPDAGTGEVGSLLGTFQVQLVGAKQLSDGSTTEPYTAILGKVYNGVQPATVVWTAKASSGGCVLSTPSVPFCTGGCGSGACVAADTCQAYPTSQSVGAVHVTGVQTTAGATAFDLTAIANSYAPPASLALAYPAFSEGDAVTVAAAGSSFTSAFTLTSPGVAPLALGNGSPIPLRAGTALTLTWTAAQGAGASKIHVKLDISHHGGSKGKLECDTADGGSLTIAASLIDALLALGAAGYPTIIVTRSSTGHAAAATGHVDVVVSSEVEAPVTVPGVTSCTTDDDCVAPATCQTDLTCFASRP
jgi:hypothetical protein